MYRPITFKLFYLFAVLFVSSCIHDDSDTQDCISDTRIELRWVGTMPVDYDERINIHIDPVTVDGLNQFTSDVYGTNVGLDQGTYKLIAWEDYDQVVVDTADWTLLFAPTSRSFVDPGLFSIGKASETVVFSNASQVIPIPMYRQVRPLVIRVNFLGEGLSFVDGLSGSVTNVALKRSLDAGFPPVSGLDRPEVISHTDAAFEFTLSDDETDGLWYTARRNLIGIDGAATQSLHLDVSFTGADDQAFSFDITEKMTGYHTEDINEPWYIVLTLRLGFNLEVTIEDWIAGPETWITAR